MRGATLAAHTVNIRMSAYPSVLHPFAWHFIQVRLHRRALALHCKDI
jgi:hypothetical protein